MNGSIVITGSSRGLGRAMAEHYLRAGHHVIGCSRGAADWTHANYTHQVADITDEAAVVEFVRECARQRGPIAALINNAGIAVMNHALLTPRSSFAEVVNTNLVGTFLVTREVAKTMMRERRGRIVNLVSIAAPLRLAGEAAYAASKAAVENLTGVLARELGPHGITINAVGPTAIDTGLTRGVPREKLEALEALQAIPRRGTAEDVINVVDFFLSERSGFITGQVVYLGGIR